MKPNHRLIIEAFFLGLVIILFCSSCKERKNFKIEPYINIKFPDGVVEENFLKTEYSPDYRRPYNIYGKYKINIADFQNIINKLEVADFSQDYRKKMCLEKVPDYLIPYDLWKFKTHFDYSNRKGFSGLSGWWNPEQNNKTALYAGFYSEKGPKKVFKCYRQSLDGRILISYSEKNQEALIMIEVLF